MHFFSPRAAARSLGAAALAVLLLAGLCWASPTSAGPAPAAAVVAAQAAADQGVRTATRLGGSRSLICGIRDLKQLKREMARPRMQKNVSGVMDVAGLPAPVAEQVLATLKAADPAQMRDEPFPVGETMVWMGLRNKGKPDVVRNIRWGGKKPFAAWRFEVDDGKTLYHFLLPKPCGNLALASSERSPKDIAAEEARKAEEARLAEEARKAEEARRTAAPPPCGLTATLTPVKGGYDVAIDGGGNASGPAAATAMTIQLVDPQGAPVTFEYEGKPMTELKVAPPFQTTVRLRKAKAGSYTVKAVTSRGNGVAPDQNCETKFDVVILNTVNLFVDGAFGKERRVRPVTLAAPVAGALEADRGVCAPLLGVKFGADIPIRDSGWRIAPGVGVAVNFDEGSNSALFAEAELNRWFGRKGFIGTGIGVWDITHSDTVAPVWLFQGGRQLWKGSGADMKEAHFFVQGRMFLDKIDDLQSNYQFWAGIRFIFK